MTKGPKDALSRLTHKEYEQSATVSDRQNDMSEYEMEVEEMADGFVGDDQLETCHVRGEPDIRVADTCRDGAFDMHCTWRDTAGEDATQEPKNNEDREVSGSCFSMLRSKHRLCHRFEVAHIDLKGMLLITYHAKTIENLLIQTACRRSELQTLGSFGFSNLHLKFTHQGYAVPITSA